MYKITEYTKQQARKLHVDVKPSAKKDKKIDVFKNGHLIASVGALGYYDYPTYIKEKGLPYANQRRRLYKLRHQKDRNKKNSPGYFSSNLLW